MAKISVKYPIGTKVTTFDGVKGMVTAIFIRGKNRTYEFSYTDTNSNPTSNNMEEVEITRSDDNRNVGFYKE